MSHSHLPNRVRNQGVVLEQIRNSIVVTNFCQTRTTGCVPPKGQETSARAELT